MPNKFITNLDLARQAEIFSGETAVFKGGMQLGIPFSGFPTGVDTSTITSLGVVDTQFAVLSGNTGTTVFNVTDPSSPYYSATATTLSNSPYTIIDEESIVETISATTYPTIMSFTAVTGSNGVTLDLSFSQPIIETLNSGGQYTGLFSNLGGVSIGTTFSDESFYNVGSVFSGANLNMEVVTLGAHASTPAWSTGTTSGTVIEYSAMTQYWTDPTIINYTSGLTLPITPESAETQTSDYVWTLTDSTIIDENLIGLKYTGYSITYSFNNLDIDPESPSVTGATGTTSADTYYFGTVVATYENFSAGTLDYKGSTNWMKIDGMSTVEERLTVGRMTINNPDTGTSVNTLGIDVDGKVVTYTPATSTAVTGLTFNDTTYDLTLGIDDGTTFTDSLAILASDIKVTGGTFNDTSGEMTFVNNSGGTFVVSGLSTDFTGNTSGTCITDLHISNLHSCSPLYINPLDEGNVYFGSTSGVTIDVANNRIGIGTETPSSQLHIAGSGANTIIRVQSEDQNNAVINLDTQTTGGAGPRNSLVQFQQNSVTKWMIGMNGLAGGTEEDNQIVIANGTDFDSNNILNINPSNGYVGLGVQAPTERLDINGNIKISGGLNLSTLGTATPVNNLAIDASGNVVSGTTTGMVETTLFNTYTGDTETALGNKVETASNIGGGEGLFSGKSGNDLQFKSLTSTGGTVTISTTGSTVNLESSGGGSSLWTDKGDSGNGINYASGDANQAYVEINSATVGGDANTFNASQYRYGGLYIGYNNDFGTVSNYIDSSVGIGTQNTWGALGTVSYTLGIGSSNEIKSGIAGFAVGANIELSGNYNVALGQSHEVYGADNKAIGQSIFIGKAANLRNNCVGIGDSMQIGKNGGADHHVAIGFGITTQYYTNERAIFFGTQTGNNSRPSAGFFQDPGGTSTHPSNFVMGSMNAMRTGAPYPVQSGAGNGIFYLHDADSLGVVAPSVDVSQAVALFASDRDSPAGNPDVTGLLVKSENGGKSWIGDRIGINVSYTGTDPDLTTSIDASLHIRGEGTTNATSSLIINDSGTNVNFEVKDDGTVVIPNVGSTTPVTNLGVDASGNVVSGTTGGGGGGGLNYISAGAVATNLEDTSNWDINGVYTGGTTATGAQADCHVDSDYWFTCVATDTWIRLIRG